MANNLYKKAKNSLNQKQKLMLSPIVKLVIRNLLLRAKQSLMLKKDKFKPSAFVDICVKTLKRRAI